MLLLAWTAVFAIVACVAIAGFLIGLRVAIVFLAPQRWRLICEVLFALLGLAVVWLLV